MRDHPLTLRERVILFFARHPEEELSTRDVMTKFGMLNRHAVRASLRSAVSQGVLACAWQPGMTGIYSAGPMLLVEVGANIKEQP